MHRTINKLPDGTFFHHYTDGKVVHTIGFLWKKGYDISFQCHNATIMKNAQGDRVIIREVK